ncbi:MAG: hypothetical protein ACJAVN_002240 [Roseivirga sp.]|jgi:hypothetical protein
MKILYTLNQQIDGLYLYHLTMPSLDQIDHLVYTAPSLAVGMDKIEALLGIRPVKGGQHPKWGTHNALLALGKQCYLEVIAPDPSLVKPQRGLWLDAFFAQPPCIATWALQTASIQQLHSTALHGNILVGEVHRGQRTKNDGEVLSWQLTDPYALPYDGAFPFFISWGLNQHPSEAIPNAGTLVEFTIAHPESVALNKGLEAIGVVIKANQKETYQLQAKIETKSGIKTLV